MYRVEWVNNSIFNLPGCSSSSVVLILTHFFKIIKYFLIIYYLPHPLNHLKQLTNYLQGPRIFLTNNKLIVNYFVNKPVLNKKTTYKVS